MTANRQGCHPEIGCGSFVMPHLSNSFNDRFTDARRAGRLPDGSPDSRCLPSPCFALLFRPSADSLRIIATAGNPQTFYRFLISQTLLPVILLVFRVASRTDKSQKARAIWGIQLAIL